MALGILESNNSAFLSQQAVQFISSSTCWFLDGTFKVLPDMVYC